MKVNGKVFAKKWMGKKVRVTHRIIGHARMRMPGLCVGWVVGYTFRRRGHTEFGTAPYLGIDGYDGGEPSYFASAGPSTPVVLVRCWPNSKPVDAAFDGIELTDEEPNWKIANGYRDEEDTHMKNLMSAWPRDEKGRWVELTDETWKGLKDKGLL